ncbi:MAG: hypothetical protein OEV01_00080 [Nitrospira sp.]|nr:hypothetical protein [Nitrospira sp.]
MMSSTSRTPRRWDVLPLLLAFCWVLLQKGCVLTPDISPAQTPADSQASVASPAPALAGEEQLGGHQLPRGGTRSGDAGRPSLRQASELLREAATMIDNNDRTAIRLILQSIAILKREVMEEAPLFQYDRVSIQKVPHPQPFIDTGGERAYPGPSWPCQATRNFHKLNESGASLDP